MARMVIPISFLDENDYTYVKNQPNTSYYIRELVKKDREGSKNEIRYIDKKIEELEKRLKNSSVLVTKVEGEEDLKGSIKNILDMY